MNAINKVIAKKPEFHLEYERNSSSLIKICEKLKKIKCEILILVGPTGSGKSTIAENITNQKNIFCGVYESRKKLGISTEVDMHNPSHYPFIFEKSPSKYAALDDCNRFSEIEFLDFLKKAKDASKIPIITIMDMHFAPEFLIKAQSLYVTETVNIESKH